MISLMGALAVCGGAAEAARAAAGRRQPYDCFEPEDNGYSYRGLVDFTSSGRRCKNWLDVGEITPRSDNGIGNHNYCRNPDESFDQPWCFTVDGGKEQCIVDECPEQERDFEAEAE